MTHSVFVFLEDTFRRESSRFLEQWKELLRFPTVSSDPSRSADMAACAAWLKRHLDALGFRSEVLPTPGHPVVCAERDTDRRAPSVLFYGHYDVQPADPLDAWQTPPFEPTLRDGRLYARGAEDNKGQLFYVLKAIEALDSLSPPGLRLKVILDGEEESGSRGLLQMLPRWRKRLAADILLVTDAGCDLSGSPTLTMGLRGVCGLTVALHGPHRDLHSGAHGGVAPNPAVGMARLIASLHRADGTVAVEGFYDAVVEPTAEERQLANTPPFDGEAYRALTGVEPVAGEARFTPPERIGLRPALDINGLHSGYGGSGMKTIIPASAMAKLTARLVPNQDPGRCLEAIVRHLRAHTPQGLKLEILDRRAGGYPLRLNPKSALQQRAATVLRRITNRPVAYRWEGGSIPVISALAKETGAEPLIAGFGREEDQVHSPNESFSIEQFRLGFLYAGVLLAELSGLQEGPPGAT